MQNPNKFLLIIVIGIILLVIGVFFAVMLRPDPTYQDDIAPDGAAHNYLLAIQNKDYTRAYSYILADYPYPKDADEMADAIAKGSWRFDMDDDFSLAVESVEMRGDDEAIVTVRKTTFHNNGLMGSGQFTRTFILTMTQEEGAWKVSGGENYWSDCWGYAQEKWCR